MSIFQTKGVENMLKLIIVEDEKRICNTIAEMSNWKDYDIIISGKFYNGVSAKKYLSENNVDIVVSDIKLPDLSGLELAEYCHINKPETKFIMISAYRDFDFVRKSLMYNVVDYITKPIDYALFFNAVKRTVESFGKTKASNFIDNTLSLKLQHLFSDFFTQKATKTVLIENLTELNIITDTENTGYAHINLYIQNFSSYISDIWKNSKELLYNGINNLVTFETEFGYSFIINFSYDNIEIIVISKKNISYKLFEESLKTFTNNLKNNLKTILRLNSEISVLECTNNLNELQYSKNSSVIVSANLLFSDDIFQNPDFIENFIHFGSSFSNNEENEKLFYSTVFSKIYSLLDEQEKIVYKDILSDYSPQKSPEKLREYLCKLYSLIKKNNTENKTYIIEKAMAFIDSNHSKNITLKDVANHVAVNSNYLSGLFKKYTNENFTDYITKVRMNKAKAFLSKTEMSVSAITYEIGYNDSHYFTRKFRLYTGMTPSEYRKEKKNEK